MTKALLDTNILLDYLIEDRKSHVCAIEIFALAEVGAFRGVISIQSILDAAYVYVKKDKARLRAFQAFIQDLSMTFAITEPDRQSLYLASKHATTDLEDAILSACARQNNCAFIVTRDEQFDNPMRIPAIQPEAFRDSFLKES